MKLACASGCFHRDIAGGELTQLEFLDLCARELACDGVILDVRHFPRTDDDYLAQLKKMAVDRGLTVAGLFDADFFRSSEPQRVTVLQHAIALGAPLVAAPLVLEVECTWSDQLAALVSTASLAKALNVTLAVRNAPNTFAAGTSDYKRVAKETDSAWVRFGPEPQALDTASEPQALQSNTVLLWSDLGMQTQTSMADAVRAFSGFRGHVVLDDRLGTSAAADAGVAVRRWREILNRT